MDKAAVHRHRCVQCRRLYPCSRGGGCGPSEKNSNWSKASLCDRCFERALTGEWDMPVPSQLVGKRRWGLKNSLDAVEEKCDTWA